MILKDILPLEAVKVYASTSSKKRLFQDIADIASDVYRVCHKETLSALLERESLGPTGVGNGIALPHARLSRLEKVVGILTLLQKPLEFNSIDRKPVDLIFTLLAPEDVGVDHLKSLALVARTLREDSSLCGKLRSNPNPNVIYTLLTETEKHKAA